MREYRLYGPDGACLLTARIKGARMLPRLVELSGETGRVARISRKWGLGRDLFLDDVARRETLRLDLPVMSNAARTTPFDLKDKAGRAVVRLAPPSGLKERTSVLEALFDNDLVLLGAEGAMLGATRQSPSSGGPWPQTPVGLFGFIGQMKRQVAVLAAQAMVRPPSDAEIPLGRFEILQDDPRITPALVMLILLFRRFDYDFMRDVS